MDAPSRRRGPPRAEVAWRPVCPGRERWLDRLPDATRKHLDAAYRRGSDLPSSTRGRKVSFEELRPAAGPPAVHRQRRPAPCPSSEQPHPELPAPGMPGRSRGARDDGTPDAARQPRLPVARALGRGCPKAGRVPPPGHAASGCEVRFPDVGCPPTGRTTQPVMPLAAPMPTKRAWSARSARCMAGRRPSMENPSSPWSGWSVLRDRSAGVTASSRLGPTLGGLRS